MARCSIETVSYTPASWRLYPKVWKDRTCPPLSVGDYVRAVNSLYVPRSQVGVIAAIHVESRNSPRYFEVYYEDYNITRVGRVYFIVFSDPQYDGWYPCFAFRAELDETTISQLSIVSSQEARSRFCRNKNSCSEWGPLHGQLIVSEVGNPLTAPKEV